MDPILLTIKEAALVLGTSRYTLYKLIDRGDIAGRWHGNRRMVEVASLKAYAENLPTSKPEKPESVA